MHNYLVAAALARLNAYSERQAILERHLPTLGERAIQQWVFLHTRLCAHSRRARKRTGCTEDLVVAPGGGSGSCVQYIVWDGTRTGTQLTHDSYR